MRILHFIPNTSKDTNWKDGYKLPLIKTMAERDEIHVLTAGKSEDIGKVVMHKYSRGEIFFKGYTSFFDKKIEEIKPDIVHIHACWNAVAYKFQKCCIAHRIPVVLTMDKLLEPWHLADNYLLCKLPKLLTYQRFMIKNAQVLQATTEQEHDRLIYLRLKHLLKITRRKSDTKKAWNSRVVTVKRFDITNGVTVTDMSTDLVKLYSKVIDSYPFMGMSDEEIKLEDELLLQGMTVNKIHHSLSDDILKIFPLMDYNSWRRIFLHSLDEGIFDYVKVGAHINGIDYTSWINMDNVSRFPHQTTVHEKDVKSNKKIARLKKDDTIPDREKKLCLLLLEILLRLENVKIHRSNFTTVYNALRFEDYDEDILRQIASRMGIKKNTARLFKLLEERYGLEEGFMFLEPLDDNKTDKFRKMLFKADIQ
ncbi:MAG: glycosyltransferase family 4 protein [Prevotella sp.]|nr:glycosyltransferase family 4 protein [Prevotella sp.]